jgi:quercetin dioxygenase-like cupin family protein
MNIRADLSQPALVLPEEWTWVPSPQAGVERVMLDRVGDEVAVATSFVRYAPDSRFPGHSHALGEEFIVLEGEFGDEHGRYPPGTYVRNPPGSQHVPFSEPGCLIWVKLRQFQTDDLVQSVATLTESAPATGQSRRELHRCGTETVAEIAAAAGETVVLEPMDQVQEVLVLEGEIEFGGRCVSSWGWLRVPASQGASLEARTPVRLFWKTRPGS